MIRSRISRGDMVTALQPLLDLIGVEAAAVMADDFIIGADSIRFTLFVPNDDGGKKAMPVGIQEPGGPTWPILSTRVEVGIDRPSPEADE